MGNSEGSTWSANKNQWKMIMQAKLGFVIEGPQSKLAQIYTIRIPSNKLLLYEQFFQKRKNKPGCMIRVFDYYKNNKLVCGYDQSYSIITERFVRLKELRGLSYQQSITMVKQILILYQNLQQTFGYFKLQPQMIGKTIEGHIKIWINQNLGQNIPSQQSQIRTQNNIEIVRRVCKIVSSKAGKHCQTIKNLFGQNKFNRYSLQKIVQILSKIQINKQINLTSLIKNQNSREIKSSIKEQNQQLINFEFKQLNKNSIIENNKQLFQNSISQPVKSVQNYLQTINYPKYSQIIYDFIPKTYQQKTLLSNPIPLQKSILPQLKFYTKNNFKTQNNNYHNFDQYLINNANNIQTQQLTKKKRIDQIQIQRLQQNYLDVSQPSFFHPEKPLLHTIYEECHESPIFQIPQSTTQSSPRYSSTMNTPPTLATQLSLKPISTLLSSSNSSMKLVSSHVFITNDDLYSHLDDMVQNEKVKLQQSQIIRRLSNKNSKVSQQ